MRVNVHSEVVRSNLELLKHLVATTKKKQASKEVDAFIEKSTGSLALSMKKEVQKGRWLPIHIRWFVTSAPEGITFEISDLSKEGKSRFAYADLSENARHVIADTIHTVNEVFLREISKKGLQKTLDAIDSTKIAPSEKDPFFNAFYDIDREAVEKLLSHHSEGTFLFRIDPFAKILEDELGLRFQVPIRCFTLTVVGAANKVIDFTIVERGSRFQIYNDDTLLENPSFSSLENLLQSLDVQCDKPLIRK